jgi:HlyD family secretion protein
MQKISDTSAQDVAIVSGRRNRYRFVGSALVLVLVTSAWLLAPALQRWSRAGITVSADRLRIATVVRDDLVRDVSAQGRVIASVSPTLYAPSPGTITLLVEAGAAVSEGQVVARISSPELENQLEQAQATREQLAVQLERQRIESRQDTLEKRKAADMAEVALVAARREKRRADEANAVAVISVLDFEKAQDDLRNAELAHAHAIADADLFEERMAFELKASELELKRQALLCADIQRRVEALEILSPVNGVVGDLLVEQKAAVARDTPVMAVVDLSRFEIDVGIPETYADELGIGMTAEITAGAETYAGRLVAVSPEIVSGQVSARVRFLDRQPANLRQNQRLMTRIVIEKRPDVLQLQRGQFLDSGGGRIAYVLVEDELATRRSISTGARGLGAVEITSGLSEGERVIISSIEPFRSKDTVLITD